MIIMPEEEFREMMEAYLKPISDELYELRTNKDLLTYTLKEAELHTGIPYKNLLRAVNSGKLKAIRLKKKFRVTRKNVLEYTNTDWGLK